MKIYRTQTNNCFTILLRPFCFLFLLGFSSLVIVKLWLMTKQIERNVTIKSKEFSNKTFAEIETIASLLRPLNSSASNLARALTSSLKGIQLSFHAIQTKVAPTLFLALSTIPHLSQVSYIGLDGLLFSFFNEGHQTLAVFSNTSFSSTWYIQPVNPDSGTLYGQPIGSNSMVTENAGWFQEALNRTIACSSLGTGWNKAQDLLFLNNIDIDGRGVISIGFPVKVVSDHFRGLENFYGGDFHLATNDGQVIVQTKLPDIHIIVNNGTISLQVMKLNGEFKNLVTNHSCKPDDHQGEARHFHAKIKGRKHIFYCSVLDIVGIQSVYVLAFPRKGFVTTVYQNGKLALTLLVLIFVIVTASLTTFILLILRGARKEMFLCAALIKQMESTQQAERKSMNKSLAFASASHDVRASLAAITGLIELCHEDATPDSELAANLVQMNTCTMDLLGILNSVLDTSKIEAGKMQLEEGEFNLLQLIEDVVDMYYPVGMKKGVDVVFDPCDGSTLKLHLVKGDRGKLKQILCNLLSNAVKFTSEGHVSVRAVVHKTSKENVIIASNRNGVLKCMSRLCYKNNESFSDLDHLHTVQQDPNYMEFVFEVDDTGKGIPKDQQKSVFENFVQVKETALGQGGCGLGLGIVQSLVRLMGGEIKIVDKDAGERGTCFRFNIFLATCDLVSTDIEGQENPTDFHQHFRLSIRSSGPRLEGSHSHVVLLIAGEERRRISKKLIENLGIKVSAVKRGKDLLHALEKVKLKSDIFHFNFSGRRDLTLNDYLNKSASINSNSEVNDGPSGSKDSNDHILPHYRKSNFKGFQCFILIVIDATAGCYWELCSTIANFRKDIQNCRCKVVWLDNPVMRNNCSIEAEEDKPTLQCDLILSKPFHGSRLYRTLGLLPEFGGTYQSNSPRLNSETTQEMQHTSETSTANELSSLGIQAGISLPHHKHQYREISEHEGDKQSTKRPLSGKRVLLVEDVELLRKLAATSLGKLGADVDLCENGKEAFDRVCKVSSDQRSEGHSKALPYDYIFMDCEMPVMDGYEATRLIRIEEKQCGIHIPIIALTAHAMAEEAKEAIQAGMDFHLTKPLQVNKMLDVIKSI